jgi:hypothetical protein
MLLCLLFKIEDYGDMFSETSVELELPTRRYNPAKYAYIEKGYRAT